MSESALTAAVLRALGQLPGVTVWRCNSGRRGRVHLAPAGTPDVIGYLRGGRFIGIETKASHGDECTCRSCTAQRAWAARAKACGVIYARVRTLDQAVELVVDALFVEDRLHRGRASA